MRWLSQISKNIIDQAETIILPGVGHFKDAMSEIKAIKSSMQYWLRILIRKMVGICLGMQLMYEHSDEARCIWIRVYPRKYFRVSKQNNSSAALRLE